MMTKTLTWKVIYSRKCQKFQMSTNFSNRVVQLSSRRGRRTREDDELVKHTHACLYPFHTGPFNPTFLEQRLTRKIRGYTRGEFTTSSADNWGFIYACPSQANNTSSLQMATNTLATAANAFANVQGVVAPNTPFAITDFGNLLLKSRITCCSLRIRNITPLLDRGGTLYAVRSPDDGSLPAQNFDSIISEYDITGNSWRCDTSGGKWNYLSWAPRDMDQMEFTPNPVPTSDFGLSNMARTMAFIAKAPGSLNEFPQTYEWEFVVHGEVLGGGTVNEQAHGATRGQSHHLTNKVHQVIAELHTKPPVALNEGNSVLAPFIVDAVKAGHAVADIVNVGCDIAQRAATILPSFLATTRALGSFL